MNIVKSNFLTQVDKFTPLHFYRTVVNYFKYEYSFWHFIIGIDRKLHYN